MSMSTGLQFDEEAARRLEAIYMTPDVVAQRQAILRALSLRPGERVLDVGSGPGFLACEMAGAVGSSGAVHAIDISESFLAMARRRCPDQPQVKFREGEATRLPFGDGTFDVAVSTQVYEYIADVDAALGELFRVLRPGGRALILDTDWGSLVWHSADRARMARILDAWDEHLADPYLPRTLSARLGRAGFRVEHREVIPLLNPELDPNTFSYGLIGLIAAFVVGRQGITQTDIDAWTAELRADGETQPYFFSLNRYLFSAAKPVTGAASSPDT
jgi:SAM-dependent methyltransferase